MKEHLRNLLLPEHLSDEAAYQLVEFVMALAINLESIYFAQIQRHLDKNSQANFVRKPIDQEPPFNQ